MTKLGCVAAHVCCKYCKKQSYDGCLVRSAWQVHTISAGDGNVSKYDVDMAAATGAMIIGFGINVPGSVMKQAELQSIDIYREKVDIEVKEIPKRFLCWGAGCIPCCGSCKDAPRKITAVGCQVRFARECRRVAGDR